MMSYDPLQWHEREMLNRPRYAVSKWMMGGGLLLVVGAAIALPIWHIGHPVSGFPPLAIAVPALGGMGLSPFSRGVWGNPGKMRADEFEMNALNRATRTAHRVTAFLAALLCFWCSFGGEYQWPTPILPSDWALMAWAFVVLGLVLPVLIAELIIPMPPKEEAECVQ